MAQLLKVDGTTIEVQPKNGHDFKLRELYEVLGVDCVELVYLRDGKRVLVVDESGWLVSNPQLNERASELYGGDIVGDALLCNRNQIL